MKKVEATMLLDKYDGLTGEETPRKSKRISNPIELTLSEFQKMCKDGLVTFDGPNAWGSVHNDRCDLYRHKDGRWIEAYCPFGWMTYYFIESN